ncbi:hypothetical protein TSUD_297250 [Trifolium subterraneum]|uniref:Reverse transcriptase zinc-binding domain-containing protein n=1 Tax=Trifolium subterraneum TaxID=3900 RepID=A0A2Z6P9W1_TRISU|nr:hypothetical protein TSUD_297250 [Trifolium subterraneum]
MCKIVEKDGGIMGSQLKEFNLALLDKWCWRLLVDRDVMWFRVLAARYGVERGSLRAGERRRSSWWREIACIRDDGGGLGGEWFKELASSNKSTINLQHHSQSFLQFG